MQGVITFNKDSPTGFYTDFAVRHGFVYDKDWKKRVRYCKGRMLTVKMGCFVNELFS